MAFTRYHDDPLRIMKQLQEFTGPGVYGLQVPGNGERMSFVADPQLRLQKWGANRHLNFVQVESELWGMQHRLTNRDCTPSGEVTSANPVQYPSDKSEVTAQPRTVTPAWEVRSVAQPRWDILQEDVQAHAMIPFQNNNETRLSVRDNFKSV